MKPLVGNGLVAVMWNAIIIMTHFTYAYLASLDPRELMCTHPNHLCPGGDSSACKEVRDFVELLWKNDNL